MLDDAREGGDVGIHVFQDAHLWLSRGPKAQAGSYEAKETSLAFEGESWRRSGRCWCRSCDGGGGLSFDVELDTLCWWLICWRAVHPC